MTVRPTNSPSKISYSHRIGERGFFQEGKLDSQQTVKDRKPEILAYALRDLMCSWSLTNYPSNALNGTP